MLSTIMIFFFYFFVMPIIYFLLMLAKRYVKQQNGPGGPVLMQECDEVAIQPVALYAITVMESGGPRASRLLNSVIFSMLNMHELR